MTTSARSPPDYWLMPDDVWFGEHHARRFRIRPITRHELAGLQVRLHGIGGAALELPTDLAVVVVRREGLARRFFFWADDPCNSDTDERLAGAWDAISSNEPRMHLGSAATPQRPVEASGRRSRPSPACHLPGFLRRLLVDEYLPLRWRGSARAAH